MKNKIHQALSHPPHYPSRCILSARAADDIY